jgi:hypothetical protein
MAEVLFASEAIGMMVLPLMLFRQIQLMVCAILAQRYTRHSPATVSQKLECTPLRSISTNTSPNPARGRHGMATAPNALTSQSAMAVLREGGNAIEAMIAAAATIEVVYPHMNSIGGDGFWLIAKPGDAPRGLEAHGV